MAATKHLIGRYEVDEYVPLFAVGYPQAFVRDVRDKRVVCITMSGATVQEAIDKALKLARMLDLIDELASGLLDDEGPGGDFILENDAAVQRLSEATLTAREIIEPS